MMLGIFMGLVLPLPIMLPPALFARYLNAGGIHNVIEQIRTGGMFQSQQS